MNKYVPFLMNTLDAILTEWKWPNSLLAVAIYSVEAAWHGILQPQSRCGKQLGPILKKALCCIHPFGRARDKLWKYSK